MTVSQPFHLLGRGETTDGTSQYITLESISTNYASLYFVFSGWIDHSGGGATNIGQGQWVQGPTIQMQGAWPGGDNAAAASYRSGQMAQYDSNTNINLAMGDNIFGGTSYTVSPNWGGIGRQWYPSGNIYAERMRFQVEFWCIQPRDNQIKNLIWLGGAANSDSASYMSNMWVGNTHLCGQTSTSAPTAMGPMNSIRIGAGCDNAGTAKKFGSYSTFSAYGMGNTDQVNTGNDP